MEMTMAIKEMVVLALVSSAVSGFAANRIGEDVVHAPTIGKNEQLPPGIASAQGSTRLLFKVGFDGTAKADFAGGMAEPLKLTRNLKFVPGVKGQALEMLSGKNSALGYAVEGNLVPERGAVSFWYKPNKTLYDRSDAQSYRCFICTEPRKPRCGSGELWFWRYGSQLRADVSDDDDSYVVSNARLSEEWNHLVFNWSELGASIFLNGKEITRNTRNASSLFKAAQRKFPLPAVRDGGSLSFSTRCLPTTFFVGGKGGSQFMDGAMDELEIWSAPLTAEEINARIAASGIPLPKKAVPVGKRFEKDGANPYVAEPFGKGGEIPDLDLIETVKFDAIPTDTNRFISRGEVRVGELNGIKYLEAGRKAEDRWAYRFILPDDDAPIYVFDVDYPDDTKRTMDVVVQGSQETRWDGTKGADYILQMGIACGDEYPNTGKILTDRYIYWRRGRDVTLSTMTCRGEAPAAISEIRLYRVKSGRLPQADIKEPPANDDGWRRTFAHYFEDVSVGYNFAVDGDGGDEKSIGPMLDRLIATMKFTGQNVFCYPGCWYGGLMGEVYSPRSHLADYRRAYLEKFDRAGIYYLPTINQFHLPMTTADICLAPGKDGTCHDSPLTIMNDGRISSGAFHGRPTSYNALHPAVQKNVLDSVDTFIAEGKGHPSFKGIVLHLTRHSLLWFGNETGGYNDYAVKAFARERKVPVPEADGDPLRGKVYADWIKANAFDEWIDWRCEKIAEFYREIARRLAAARPDLKLVINSFLLPDCRHADFTKSDFLETANRRAGLDARKLADVSNIAICQSEMPADYRWFGPLDPTNPKDRGRWGDTFATSEPIHRVMYSRRGDFGSIYLTTYPWINQHDRYWESHTAATKDVNCHGLYYRDDKHGPMRVPWLKECPWRVSTVNPSGRDALRAYALPMRYTDVLAHSKGGFLVGTYGTEDVLVPWMRAFRALPAVKMSDCGGNAFVKIRTASFRGKTYFYVLNTDNGPRSITFDFPEGTVDLISNKNFHGATTLKLEAYELRSYMK
jgi:hypothetical protein